MDLRGQAHDAGTTANWAFNFIVSLTFLTLIDEIGRDGASFLYGGICAFTVYFCWKLVPETKGLHLENIQAIFRERAKDSTG